ncbi:MAG TPA: DNA polymerase I [Caulobacteraceae bacterium]|jgi:DNA polymerase-1|nr:DNA polymerase I [Caulobacteraceae bacterium]
MTDTLDAPARPLTQDGPAVRLFLIDGSGYIFRAYHALPPLTRKSDGLPVGAVAGFCNMLWKLLRETKGPDAPTHLAVIFDASEKTFRNDMYDQYKAHRPPAPEDLIPQFGLVREATRAFGVSCVELNGYEADDLIATYACAAEAAGGEAVIVSSDKDLMQLVRDKVAMFDPMKNLRIGREQVIEKFGVPPEKVIDVQSLIGDSVDNVPGAPGIGVKTAQALITEYGDLDTLLARAGEIKQDKRRQTLIDFADQIRLSRQLVTLICDAPMPETIDSMAVRHPDPATLGAFLEKMEFRTLAKRVGDGKIESTSTPSMASPSAPISRAQADRLGAPAPAVATGTHVFDVDAYECVQSIERLDVWIARCFEAGVVGFDTETDALSSSHANLCGVSLSTGPNQACYIPLGHLSDEGLALSGSTLEQVPLEAAVARLKLLLEDPGVLKVGQNIKYDMAVLLRYGVNVAPIDDTMLMSYVLDQGVHGHGMDELSKLMLGHEPIPFKQVAGAGKTLKSFKHVELKPATCYAAEDADVTLRLWSVLKPRLAREGLLTVYETLERGMPAVLAEMECTGIRVDPERLRLLSNEFGKGMAEFEAKAHALAGRPFNLGSPKQIGDILFGELSLPGGKKTATGAWGTDASVLEELAQSHELPRTLLDWRQLSKLKGTYTDALVAAADEKTQRVHTSFQLAASSTGRLASSDPNLQNIPIRTETGRQIRQAFIADEGNVLISADYSQIELRLLAHIGDIPQLKAAFAAGQDIHATTASEMFGVAIEGMPSDVRRRAKAINFGIIYGISAFGLSNQLGISREEAGAYIATYFERFPGIRGYMEQTRALVREQGFVSTLFGRKVNIPEIRASNVGHRQFAERAAINAPIQGTAADIIRRAMMRMPAALKKAGLKTQMLLQVHDELVFEAPQSEAEAASTLIKQVMERAAEPAVALSVPLTVEARWAKNWDEAH